MCAAWQNQQKSYVYLVKTQISLGIHPVWSVFIVHSLGSKRPKVSSGGQRRLWSDWAGAQADRSLHWAHRSFCWFCHAVAHVWPAKTKSCLNISVVGMKKLGTFSVASNKTLCEEWSDCLHVQAILSLRWVHNVISILLGPCLNHFLKEFPVIRSFYEIARRTDYQSGPFSTKLRTCCWMALSIWA